jgi:hypothetical protein
MQKNAGTVALLIRGLWVRVPRGPQVYDLVDGHIHVCILSFDSLVGKRRVIVAQPALRRAADVYGYAYVISAGASVLALPFLLRARTLAHPADREETGPPTEASAGSAQQVDA